MNNRFLNRIRCWGSLTAIVCLAFQPGSVQAVQRPPERSLVGVVESVDPSTSSVTVKVAKTSKSLKLGLPGQVKIQAPDGKRTSVANLNVGSTVEVRYRSLLLGVPQATHVHLR